VTSAGQARERASRAPAPASSARCSALPTSSDRPSSSLKTSTAALVGGCALCGDRSRLSDIERPRSISASTTAEGRTAGGGCSSWPTPTVTGNHNRKGASATSQDGLMTVVKRWPTPMARDVHGPTSRHRIGSPGLPNATGCRGRQELNPSWVLALMGFPTEWFDGLRPPDHKPRGSRRASSEASKGEPRSSRRSGTP
jgi:hypothetical protein